MYEKISKKLCGRCNTLLDFKGQEFCCDRGGFCYADINVVKRIIKQRPDIREMLIKEKIISKNGKLLKSYFWKITPLKNSCLIYDHRPVPCRVHFCQQWVPFLKKNKNTVIKANIKKTDIESLIHELSLEFEHGPQASHGGGYFIITRDPHRISNALMRKLKAPITHLVDEETINEIKPSGIKIVLDDQKLLKGRTVMLANEKVDPREREKDYSYIFVSNVSPEEICQNSFIFLTSFLAFKSYQVG